MRLPRFPRFKRFGSRLLLLIVGLVAVFQCATYFLAKRENSSSANQRILENLDQGADLFGRRVNLNVDELAVKTDFLFRDYAFRGLLLQETPDKATIRSALESFCRRMNVSRMVLMARDGSVLGGIEIGPVDGPAFQALARKALADQADKETGYIGLPGSKGTALYVLLVVPIYAPYPEVQAWIGMAYPIGQDFANDLKRDTRLEVTFLYGNKEVLSPVESTLPAEKLRDMQISEASAGQSHSLLTLQGEPYVTMFRTLPLLSPGSAAIALQRSLTEELASSQKLERFLMWLMLASILAAALVAYFVARGVSQPVQALAEHTLAIAKGDYALRLNLDRADELGQLANAFNRMSEGLAERDRVRDLLDKNVSPEVAAQLLRDGDALGGEERTATIMFVDLRNFTGISESLPPKAVLNLLNRYLNRMTGIIEAHHGIVDKFIGDAIMAVFGAPVANPASADDALMAAIKMKVALSQLNEELRDEGKLPLAFGIGINTSSVVAGKMGSLRRLNYSVIGDGVNVAARIQDLTRDPAHMATILVSESTLNSASKTYRIRPLGSLPVKGRSEPVGLFAVDGMA